MKFESGYTEDIFRDTVLLVPAISIANIPQLSLDLLLHSLDFRKVATLSDTYLYPFVSPVDGPESLEQQPGVSFGLEAYVCRSKKLTVVQQRAPLLPGYSQKHVSEVIVPLIKSTNFKHVVFLNSLDAGLSQEYFPGAIKIYSSEDVLAQSLGTLHISDTPTDALSRLSEYSSLYAKSFVENVSKVCSLSVIVIYAYEGDNFNDARQLSEKVSCVLSLDVSNWLVPFSWYGVYGDKPVPLAMEEGIYG